MRPVNIGVVAARHGSGTSGDPYYGFVTSLIQGRSDIVDEKGNFLTLAGGVANGTAYTPLGAIDFDGVNDTITINGANGQFTPGTAPFCIEFFTITPAAVTAYQLPVDTSGNGSANNGFFIEYAPQRAFFMGAGTPNNFSSGASGVYYTDNVGRHMFCDRDSNNVFRMGQNGKIVRNIPAMTANIVNTTGVLRIGGYAPPLNVGFYKGAIWGWRVTIGASRYTGAMDANYVVPTLPYPTTGPNAYTSWNSNDKGTAVTLSNNNLTMTYSAFSNSNARSVIGKLRDKWYWELTINAKPGANAINFGVRPASAPIGNTLYLQFGIYRIVPGTFVVGDVFGIAFDAGTGACQAYKNGALLGNMTGSPMAITEPWKAVVGEDNAPGGIVTANFGATPFVYAPPDGYNAGLYSITGQPTMPLDLPGGLGWYDFSDTSTLTLSGSEIASVADKSGNGNHLVQPTSANRFLTGGLVKGRNAAISSATDNMAFSKFNPFFTYDSCYVFAVFGSTSARSIMLDGQDFLDDPLFFETESGGVVESWFRGAGLLSIYGGAATSDGSINVHSVTANAVNTTASFNNLTDSDVGFPGTQIHHVGGRNNSSYGVVGNICEIFFGNAALSPSDIAAVKTYLYTKWTFQPTTWNPEDKGTNVTLSNNNLTMSYAHYNGSTARSIIGKTTGKWYWELTVTNNPAQSALDFGVRPASSPINNSLYQQTGIYRVVPGGFAVNDVLGIAFDAGTGACQAYKNGVLLGNMTGSPMTISEPWKAVVGDDNAIGGSITANFGATAFVYAPPSGYTGGLLG